MFLWGIIIPFRQWWCRWFYRCFNWILLFIFISYLGIRYFTIVLLLFGLFFTFTRCSKSNGNRQSRIKRSVKFKYISYIHIDILLLFVSMIHTISVSWSMQFKYNRIQLNIFIIQRLVRWESMVLNGFIERYSRCVRLSFISWTMAITYIQIIIMVVRTF